MPSSRGSRPAPKSTTTNSPPAGDLRWRIGAIALVLLFLAGYLAWQEFFTPQADNQPAQWFAAALRVGLVMAAVWLAWPELRKLSPWFLGLLTVLLPITLIVIAKWPRYLPVFLIGGVVLYILRPRGNRRAS
jgi:cytochrome bd-type quinol oxidase subunit 2